jgi:hypothetical protein
MAFSPELLRGAYDLHVHVFPDVVGRSKDLVELAKEAAQVGMAGLVIKDHTTSTVGRCFVMNRMVGGPPRFFSSLALNPPVGGLNPTSVEAALRAGTDIIYFPTYGARNHILKWGIGKPPTPFPVPERQFPGITIFDEKGHIKGECKRILQLIKEFDAVLATGHISPGESLELLREGARCGIKRMIVTHASQSVVAMDMRDQKEAVGLGAFIEHSFFALTPSCPNPISMEILAEQIREVGVEHVILSSDLGQRSNPPPVEGFGEYLSRLRDFGFSLEEMRVMIEDNPRKLLEGREGPAQ